MGNKCSSCLNSQSTDEAEDALLGQEQPNPATSSHVVVSTGERRHRLSRTRRLLVTRQQAPREPPPPYQQVNPFYMLTEEQRLNLVTRIALIQSLPVGTYECTKEKKLPLEEDNELTSEEEKELLCCEKSENIRECPICMNEFQQSDPIRLLPCMHYYHTRCIDEWLMRSITCPNCMQRVDVAFQRTVPRRHRRTPSRGSTGATAGHHAATPVFSSAPFVSMSNSNPPQNPGSCSGIDQTPTLQPPTTNTHS